MGRQLDTPMTTQDSSPQRTATRAPVGKPIRLQFDGTSDIAEGVCRNISIGGMFIEASVDCAHGSLVRFELVLDDDSSIRGLAEVVWVRSKAFGPGHESGIGIKFRFLEQQDRQLIFKLVSQYIKERLASRPPMSLDPAPAQPSGEILQPPDPPVKNAPQVSPARPSDVASPSALRYGAAAELSPLPRDRATTEELSTLDAQAAGESGTFEGGAPSPWPGEAVESVGESPAPSAPFAAAPSTPGASAPGAPSYFDDAPIDLNAREQEPVWHPDPELTGAIDAPTFGAADAPAMPQVPRKTSRRPKRRSSLLPLLILGVVLALLVFFFRDRIFGPPPPMDEPLPSQIGTMAEPTSAGSPTAGQEGSAGGSTATQAAPQVGVEVPVDAVASPPRGPASRAEPPPTSPSSAEAAPPPPAASAGPEMRRIEDIQWRRAGQGLEITVTADGQIPSRRVKSFRLGGDSPREVIQLLGIGVGYGEKTLAVGGPGVRQIRSGLNERNGGKELRLVLDLTGSSVRVTELRPEGRQLVIRVEFD